MKLGLLADIHEDSARLARAIELLHLANVDQFVMLGDVFEMGKHIEETVALLTPLNSVGVWGNHDFGLCREVSERTRSRYSPEVLNYFASLEPFLEIDGCWFQHIEPFLDSEKLEDLWSYGGDGILSPTHAFTAKPHRRFFMGHVHRWDCITPNGRLEWNGTPLQLNAQERYLITIHAVVNGWCATFDTSSDELVPIRI